MGVLILLKRLDEYFDNSGKLFGQFSSADIQLSDFSSLIGDIDEVIRWNFCDMLTRGNNFTTYLLSWWRLRISDFNAVYNASVKQYEPLENYTMEEETATGRSRGQLESSTDSDVKPRVSAQYETTNDDQSTGRLTGYNVAGLQNSGATPETSGSENTKTTSQYNTTATLTADTLSATANEVETVQHKRHGNIGVLSSQDMLKQEYDVRARSFIMFFCEVFARECLSGLYDTGGDFD